MKQKWLSYYKTNRKELFITIFITAIILFSLTRFLIYIENRAGVILTDPVLSLYTPVNLTWFTFAVIYISLIIALLYLINHPERLVFALQVYGVMVLFRITAMYILPLDPPAGMIILADPFVELFGSGKTLTRDLFFSGHTATLFILYLISDKKFLKAIFITGTVLIAVFVLLQHVHYTIDVLAAPFFAYGSYAIIKLIKR